VREINNEEPQQHMWTNQLKHWPNATIKS